MATSGERAALGSGAVWGDDSLVSEDTPHLRDMGEILSHALQLGLERTSGRSPEERGRVSGTFSRPTSPGYLEPHLLLAGEALELRRRSDVLLGQAYTLSLLRSPTDLATGMQEAARTLRSQATLLDRSQAPDFPVMSDRHVLQDLYVLALDVGTERCIVDGYSALRLAYQGHRTADENLGGLLRTLALQQFRQANLYWDVFDWALGQLSPARGRYLHAEQRRAVLELRSTFPTALGERDELLGSPSEFVAHSMLDALERDWFDDAAA